MKNKLYWSYNLPLQIWPEYEDPEDETSKIVGHKILNYMPRRERTVWTTLDEIIEDQTRSEFLNDAAIHLENLAKQMRDAAEDNNAVVYYPDAGMVREGGDERTKKED